MIEVRNAAQWANVPFEAVDALPATALDDLWELITRRERWIVGDRADRR